MAAPAFDRSTALAPTTIGSVAFAWGTRTFVMGILNVTPDSFSGDGLLAATAAGGGAVSEGSATRPRDDGAAQPDPVATAVDQARRMVAEGADLLDVGGESTRPGHVSVDPETEARRVIPVIAAVRAALPDVPISIDTTKPAVAEAGLDAGANLLNDIWGVGPDDALLRIAARRRVPIVLMHNRAEARYDDLVAEVVTELQAAVRRAVAAGVPRDDVIVDPGIGFGKTAEHNLAVLHDLEALRSIGRPILLGTSRKSTLGKVLDLPPDQRVEATLATTAIGVAAGVDIVRVHDVRENVRAARMADAIVRR